MFNIVDLIVLKVYSRLLEQEIPARRAGHMACGIHGVLRSHPQTARVPEVMTAHGGRVYFRSEDFDREAERVGISTIMEVREFRLDLIRDMIVHELEDEAGIVGEE